ncbi:unnamed protein product [Gongylonema pulchrum]|uniref:Ovule protein n=1 Tax=Gongylonema pulchrum TaxID=637853 RepID=A0A183EUH2_9BILA|nr:unnamed protein product [Gongylonema pulchrum]
MQRIRSMWNRLYQHHAVSALSKLQEKQQLALHRKISVISNRLSNSSSSNSSHLLVTVEIISTAEGFFLLTISFFLP